MMRSLWWYPWRALRELGWWLMRLFRLVGRHPFRTLVLGLVVGWFAWGRDDWRPMILVTIVLLGFGLWARLAPAPFDRWVSMPLFRYRKKRFVRRSWGRVLTGSGLVQREYAEQEKGRVTVVPSLRRLQWRQGRLIAVPGILFGQTVEDYQAAAEKIRTAFNARRLLVVPNANDTACELVMLFGDALAAPFQAPMPELSSVQTDKVLVGRTEEDAPWSLPLISTVLAGSSGSGKGSVMWAIVLALGPAVRIGLVELLGIDLKGGVEMKMAPKLFTRLATTAEEAVQLLEETVISMQRRLDEMGGVTRLHEPKVGAPAVVVVIDELAALTSYITDRDLKKRGEAALALILTMGRAPGFHVLAFVQDPRKEVLGMRQHFKQLFGLRLAEKEEVAMVLGEGAVARGAACHKIPPGKPGTGYVRGENGMITRVRAGFVTDAMLRQANELFRAPRQIPIIPPGPEVENPKPNRRPRKPRRKADEDQDETPLKNPGDCENPDDGEHPGRKPRRRRRPRNTGQDNPEESS
ncbi:FtsK/SpoIIIE domain-containing protein [Naumannella halotolerans]|uniref:S-DNA-T family DNA segregation ATPase FtsK/SpoIIIE n=1 Tax=Naumannella halotolerans TaxID=993414 RepID=A0A4R7IWV4_9ACTN|nr:FtsK/SpoIIIE domain-containing protein [Naumannella halotolerans]TDT29085.1 S-DNA-T family DNA segregation ATPase FtsK/SpoIIIE [Naumannella halotolerans]